MFFDNNNLLNWSIEVNIFPIFWDCYTIFKKKLNANIYILNFFQEIMAQSCVQYMLLCISLFVYKYVFTIV